MDTIKLVRMGLVLVVLSSPCFAHHGVAPHYDANKPVTIDGVIAKFDFINPHSFVYIETIDDTGNKQLWQCETASRAVLARNGLREDMFKIGERVRLEGIAGRRNPTGCAFRVAYFSDGSVLRSNTLFGPTLASAAEIPSESNSVYGIWTMKEFAVSMYEGVLTAAGERARAAFDPVADDPAIYCDPASPVRFWVNVNEPFEIRREGDGVIVEHRFMDTQRVVHLNSETSAAAGSPTTMGYSVGRFEGAALVITTDNFSAGTLEPRRAVMHTQNLKFSERLEVNEDTGDLEITWVIDDPEYFKTPLTQKEYFVRSQRAPEPYNCVPGYQQ